MNLLRPLSLTARYGLTLLLLASAPALHAGERSTLQHTSPYRLTISADYGSPLSIATAPYQFDQRYRMEQAGAATLSDKPYARQIDAAARDAGLDPAFVHAVISVESAYQSAAVSPKGAVGLMQVLPGTALRYGVSDPSGVNDNLRAGTRHLRGLMDLYDNRVDLVLAAYNAGEGAVKRYNNTIPPYAETRNYVPAVIGKYQATTRRPLLKTAMKLPAHDYLAGTRLDSTALSRLR